MPSTLNNLLIALGRQIGQITMLALAAALFIAPVTAILMASFYISFSLAHGAGEFLGFVIFCVLVGLSGWYVTPHVQPQNRQCDLGASEIGGRRSSVSLAQELS